MTKEITIEELVRVFSCFTSEKIEIHKNLSKKDFEKLFKGSLRPRKDARKKVYFVAFTGHGC